MTQDANRELLKAAAKAAGYDVWFSHPSLNPGKAFWRGQENSGGHEYPEPKTWDPINDDGDALRLAVTLRLEIDIHHAGIAVRTPTGIKVLVSAEDEPNANAATRRAIVRAAAAKPPSK